MNNPYSDPTLFTVEQSQAAAFAAYSYDAHHPQRHRRQDQDQDQALEHRAEASLLSSAPAAAQAILMTPQELEEQQRYYALLQNQHFHHLNHHSSPEERQQQDTEAHDEEMSNSAATEEERIRAGQCSLCGEQLYRIKTKSSSKKIITNPLSFFSRKSPTGQTTTSTPAPATTTLNITRIPLTVPGRVERGQCLCCCKTAPSNAAAAEAEAVSFSENSNSNSDLMSSTSLDSHCSENHNHHETSGLLGWMGGTSTPPSSTPPSPHVHPTTTAHGHGHASNSTSSAVVPTSMTAVYEGPFNEYGQSHGKGRMTWANGDVYVGEFFNGTRHGHGSLHFASAPTTTTTTTTMGHGTAASAGFGGEYIGDWECNQMHGMGTRRFANGDMYIGGYKHGKRCCSSDGRFYFSNGDLYTGSWRDDEMNGPGRYFYSGGQRFEGTFRNGKRHGVGKFQHVDGTLDFYRYEQDKRVGEVGVRWALQRDKAWKLNTKGKRIKKISVEEALTLVYHMEDNVENNNSVSHVLS